MLSAELISAIEADDLIKFNQLLQADKTQVNETDAKGLSLLFHAITHHKLPFINALITAGADVNQTKKCSPYSTPLTIAAHIGYLDTVTCLLANGAKVNPPNIAGNTALLAAAEAGHELIVKTLVAAGADVNVEGQFNATPMLDAVYIGHKGIIEILIAAGANASQAEFVPISQSKVIDKFCEYIDFQAKRFPDKYHREDVDRIAKEIPAGQCSGFRSLWLWHKQHGSEELFFQRLQRIVKWEGHDLSKDLEIDFELLMNEIFWLQQGAIVEKPEDYKVNFSLDGVEQYDLNLLFNVIAREKLQHEFEFGFVLRPKEIANVLAKIIFDNKMVAIGGRKHGIAIVKSDGQYCLYDPNSLIGVKVYETINALAEGVKKTLYMLETTVNVDLFVDIFDIDGAPVPSYPKTSDIIRELIEERKHEGCIEPVVAEYEGAKFTSLLLLLQKKDLAGIQALIELEGLDTTAIYEAVKYKLAEVIPELIKQGAKVNQANKDGLTPMWLATCSRDPVMMRLLVSAGADINAENSPSYNCTPLYVAIKFGGSNAMKILLELNVNVNPPWPGTSPLLCAMEDKQLEIAQLLINAKADLDKPNAEGTTPLIYAVMNNQPEIALALIAKGAKVNVQNSSGMTALLAAISKGNQFLIDKLKAAGAVETPKLQMPKQQHIPKSSSGGSSPGHDIDINVGDLPPTLPKC